MRIRRERIAFPGGPASVLSLGQGGVPVLLLHGFAGDLLTWHFNIATLAADRRAVAVDLPGHGESTLDVGSGRVADFAFWVERLLDVLNLPLVHAVGHSMGGYVALSLARRAPERVASLSLVASAGVGPRFDADFLRRLPALADGAEALALASMLFARPSPLTERLASVMLAQAGDPRRRLALEAIVRASFLNAGEAPPVDWAALPMPVQFLWGRQDRIIPVPDPSRLPPSPGPSSPLHLFDNAGHLPHSEAAGPVTAVLRDFLTACDA
ncbi:MAG TPA: alpha/beta fold hydrolase [Azospirillum sp.]|nr:alpha/beta fold hydrolase [Azospirillum sp.]